MKCVKECDYPGSGVWNRSTRRGSDKAWLCKPRWSRCFAADVGSSQEENYFQVSNLQIIFFIILIHLQII